MRDIELYRHLLGLEKPWKVERVELSVGKQRVDVWAGHAEGVDWPCPECQTACRLYDHHEERVWRHLDSCQFMTYLHARPPRVECGAHGIRQVRLPWADPHARFTLLFERMAIDLLQETDVWSGAQLLHLSWDETWHLLERAVRRGQERKEARVIRRVGIDEKAIAKGQKYATLVCDLERSTVEYIGNARRDDSLDPYWAQLTPPQKAGIEAIAMDMWDPFIKSVRDHLPEGQSRIVFDRYHIMKHVGDAVDRVRRREHRDLKKAGDETLTGSKYLWLYAHENLPAKHQDRFDALKARNLKTGRAWAIKESLREFWNCLSSKAALSHWKRWYYWATHSRLAPVIEKARMIQRHLANVMTFFTHRITNAVAEGINSKIATIQKMACGFRNPDHFKTVVYFRCGGLDLYPVTH